MILIGVVDFITRLLRSRVTDQSHSLVIRQVKRSNICDIANSFALRDIRELRGIRKKAEFASHSSVLFKFACYHDALFTSPNVTQIICAFHSSKRRAGEKQFSRRGPWISQGRWRRKKNTRNAIFFEPKPGAWFVYDCVSSTLSRSFESKSQASHK